MIVPRNTVLQGHVLDKLKELPNDCIDVVVTSTPYYGLRDYGPDCVAVWNGKTDCEHNWETEITPRPNGGGCTDGYKQETVRGSQVVDYHDRTTKSDFCSKCGAWKGQLGLEPHPSMFIEHLAQVFLEIKRVLKPSGSLWLNLGDTYFGGNGQYGRPEGWKDLENDKLSGHAPGEFIKERNKLRSNWLQPKQKMLIPARVAIALQDQGWILRNELVWHKVNHMPESCRDRLTRSWESVYFFVKNSNPIWSVNSHTGLSADNPPTTPLAGQDFEWVEKEVSIESEEEDFSWTEKKPKTRKELVKESFWSSYDYYFDLAAIRKTYNKDGRKDTMYKGAHKDQSISKHERWPNALGANPGDVWTLTNEGLKEEHFAAFPQKLVKQILECSTPKEICNQCGKPKTRIIKKNGYIEGNGVHVCRKIVETQHRVGDSSIFLNQACNINRSFVGWSDCGHGANFHSGLVLDPFAGAGTTLLVAHKMGYDWLGIELVKKYCDIIEKRIERHGRVRLDGFMEQPKILS